MLWPARISCKARVQHFSIFPGGGGRHLMGRNDFSGQVSREILIKKCGTVRDDRKRRRSEQITIPIIIGAVAKFIEEVARFGLEVRQKTYRFINK